MRVSLLFFLRAGFIIALLFFSISSARAEQVVTSNKVTVACDISDLDVGIEKGQMQFSNDGISWSREEPYAVVEANWSLSRYGGNGADGLKTIYGRFSDSLGNWTKKRIKIVVLLDTVTPTTSASSAGGTYTAAQSVTLNCDDGIGSGCSTTYYTTDGTEPTINSLKYSKTIAVNTTSNIKYFSMDIGGNTENVKTENYIILAGAAPADVNALTERASSNKENDFTLQHTAGQEQEDAPTVNELGKVGLFMLVMLQFAKKDRKTRLMQN